MKKQIVLLLIIILIAGILAGCTPKRPPRVERILLVGQTDNNLLEMAPVDQRTLLDLPKHRNISLGNHYVKALSNDSKKLAIVSWPGENNKNGKLRILDLRKWKISDFKIRFNEIITELTFGKGTKTLYWTKPIRSGAKEIPRYFELYRYELGNKKATLLSNLPAYFYPQKMNLIQSSNRLVIYGYPTQKSDPVATDAPHFYVVNPRNGNFVSDIKLSGVKAGLVKTKTADKNTIATKNFSAGLGWNKANHLYVAHPDKESISFVDFSKGKVIKQVTVERKITLLDRLSSLLILTAQAASAPVEDKQSILSPDGKKLYVTGRRQTAKAYPDQQRVDSQQFPGGLQIINTKDLTEHKYLDLPVTTMSQSPDGRWLMLTGSSKPNAGKPSKNSGLYLFDTKSMKVSKHLLKGLEPTLHGFSANNRYAYVSILNFSGGHYARVIFRALDLKTMRFVSERILTNYGDLILTK